ncbi:unnamed protein product [Sphagnum jensenii]|uniref:Uncharacterized protein n=1 Tax=Sphagnum jensenii TaxID=128206 RepID=A0ABP1A784_9BRYO
MRLLPVYYGRAYYKRVAIVEISFDIAVPVLLLLWIVNLRRSIAGSSSLVLVNVFRTLVNGDKLAAV